METEQNADTEADCADCGDTATTTGVIEGQEDAVPLCQACADFYAELNDGDE